MSEAEWRIIASMWWCGDCVCDCTQPVVERISIAGPPFKIERLWEGTFVSHGSGPEPGESERQWVELIEARSRFNAEQGWRDEDVTGSEVAKATKAEGRGPVSEAGYCPRHRTRNEACGECDDALLAKVTAERDAALREQRWAYTRGYRAGRVAQKAREKAAPLVARLRARYVALQRERQRDYQRGYGAGRARGPRGAKATKGDG